LKALYKELPDKYTDIIEGEAEYARVDNYKDITVKALLITFGMVTLISWVLLPYRLLLTIPLGILFGVLSGLGVPLAFFSVHAEQRKTKTEEVLPDALRLISSNTRSGHTLEKSFLLSARDEFGPLSEELRLTAMEMYGGIAVEDALHNLEDRVKSEMFQETLKLLIDGIQAGGDKANLLESSARDIRSSMEVRQEIQSSIRMYAIFIVMVAMVGAPVLFSVSLYMSEVTTDMWDDADVDLDEGGAAGGGGEMGFEMDFESPDVDLDFFQTFAYFAILITNIFASLIISEIRNGNVKSGIKYASSFMYCLAYNICGCQLWNWCCTRRDVAKFAQFFQMFLYTQLQSYFIRCKPNQ